MHKLLFFSLPSRTLFFAWALVLPLLTACSSGGGNDAVDAANAQNDSTIGAADVTAKQEADAQFLVKTTSNSLLTVELGKLVQARASTPIVRAYGTRLVQNRLELLAALRTLADTKKLAVPPALGGDEQAAYHELSALKSARLDKRAMALIIKIQKQDEDAFDKMSDKAYDGDIRGFAAKYLNPVQEMLAGAKEVEEDIEDLP